MHRLLHLDHRRMNGRRVRCGSLMLAAAAAMSLGAGAAYADPALPPAAPAPLTASTPTATGYSAASIAVPYDQPTRLAALIRNRFAHDLGDDAGKLKIDVTPVFGGHFAVSITGELDSQGQVDKDKATADATLKKIRVDDPVSIPDDKDTPYYTFDVKVKKPVNPEKATADAITQTMGAYLSNEPVTVKVQALPAHEFKVFLAGALPGAIESDRVLSTAQAAAREFNKKNSRSASDATAATAASARAEFLSLNADSRIAASRASAAHRAVQYASIASKNARGAAAKKAAEQLLLTALESAVHADADAANKHAQAELALVKSAHASARAREAALAAAAEARGISAGIDRSGYAHIDTTIDIDRADIVLDPRDEIKRRFTAALGEKDLAIAVSDLNASAKHGSKRYRVLVSGSVANRSLRSGVKERLSQILKGFSLPVDDATTLTNSHVETDTTGLYVTDRDTADFWPIRYLGGQGKADLQQAAVIDSLVDALNFAYGGKDTKAVTRDGNELHLRGKQSDILKMKTALALIDSSQPQVQMDFYAVQLSGSYQDVAAESIDARKKIQHADQAMRQVSPYLKLALQNNAKSLVTELDDPNTALAQVYQAMYPRVYQLYRSRPQGGVEPFSLSFTPVESLILMGVSKNRVEIVTTLQQLWKTSPTGWPNLGIAENAPFCHLKATLDGKFLDADLNGVKEFLQAVYQYQALVAALGLDGEPTGARLASAPGSDGEKRDPYEVTVALRNACEGLGTHAAAVDQMIKHLIDAFQADLTEMYIEPMISGLQADPDAGHTHGVVLLGQTHMEVTSRQLATLTPQLFSSVETTRPAPFGSDLLSLIAPSSSAGGSAASTAAPTGSTTVTTTNGATTTATTTPTPPAPTPSAVTMLLPGLSNGSAALLGAALLADVAPTFSQVAPGINITIRPSMAPDGSSADLTLDSSFGVVTSALGSNPARTDVWAQAEPDAIQSDHVTTQVYVSGFNLFNVSSFNVETATPQAPDRIPLLSRLPLLGPVFQFPRGSKRVEHESLILINAALRPTALGLIGFYGKSPRDGVGEPGTDQNNGGMSLYSTAATVEPSFQRDSSVVQQAPGAAGGPAIPGGGQNSSTGQP